MNIFLGIKYDKDALVLVPEIKEIIKKLGHTAHCFAVDEPYIEDTKEMMKQAFQKIDEADMVIFESSATAFGVGIEAGYAFAKSKKIITILNELEEPSSTMKGVSDAYMVYRDFDQLEEKLREYL